MAAATSRASCPAPDIWKKIFCWRFSRISRSSILRDMYITRYISMSCSEVSPSYVLAARSVFAGFGSAVLMAINSLYELDEAGGTTVLHLNCKWPALKYAHHFVIWLTRSPVEVLTL